MKSKLQQFNKLVFFLLLEQLLRELGAEMKTEMKDSMQNIRGYSRSNLKGVEP